MSQSSGRAGPALEPAVIVIFGITGDLSQRYLLPSLYQMVKDGLLDEQTEIVGVSRRDLSADELFDKVELCVNETDQVCDPGVLAAMRRQTSMFQMDLDDPAAYDALAKRLDDLEEQKGACLNRLYYLSIPPKAYLPVIQLLGGHNLNASCRHDRAVTRLLVEKPFGYDFKSAETLIAATGKVFSEDRIYRIDHYMAKQTVRNLLTYRLENQLLEPLLNRRQVAGIEIIAKEKIGIEGRRVFYEPMGALRDFIQSHLLQILGILTMDEPESADSRHIHQAKQAVLEQVEPVPTDKVSRRAKRGQYNGYREEVQNPESITETYADLTVFINNDRWQGVPLRMVTGKALDERLTEIKISFRDKNILRFRIQPEAGVEIELSDGSSANAQGLRKVAESYRQDFQEHLEAYERVLTDAVRGDQTLFASSQEVLAGWRAVQPVLDGWSKNAEDLIIYEPGTADFPNQTEL